MKLKAMLMLADLLMIGGLLSIVILAFVSWVAIGFKSDWFVPATMMFVAGFGAVHLITKMGKK